MPIIKYSLHSQNHEIKKLVLLYWENIERVNPTTGALLPEMLLVCNALKLNLDHPNEYIRGVTLRFLTRIREREILESLVVSVTQSLNHRHSFVRRNAILALYSIYETAPELVPDAPEHAHNLLLNEYNVSTKRSALLFLVNADAPRAVHYLHSNISTLHLQPDLIQTLLIHLIKSLALHFSADAVTTGSTMGIILNPAEPISSGLPSFNVAKLEYIKALHNVITASIENLTNTSSSKSVVSIESSSSQSTSTAATLLLEASNTLLLLTQSASAAKAAINGISSLLDSIPAQSEPTIRFLVFERLISYSKMPKLISVLQSCALNICISAFRSDDHSVASKAVELVTPLIVSSNVDAYVNVLKSKLEKLENILISSTPIGEISITGSFAKSSSNNANVILENAQAVCVTIVKSLCTLAFKFQSCVIAILRILSRYLHIIPSVSTTSVVNPFDTKAELKSPSTLSVFIAQLLRDACYLYPSLRYHIISSVLPYIHHITSAEVFRIILWSISEFTGSSYNYNRLNISSDSFTSATTRSSLLHKLVMNVDSSDVTTEVVPDSFGLIYEALQLCLSLSTTLYCHANNLEVSNSILSTTSHGSSAPSSVILADGTYASQDTSSAILSNSKTWLDNLLHTAEPDVYTACTYVTSLAKLFLRFQNLLQSAPEYYVILSTLPDLLSSNIASSTLIQMYNIASVNSLQQANTVIVSKDQDSIEKAMQQGKQLQNKYHALVLSYLVQTSLLKPLKSTISSSEPIQSANISNAALSPYVLQLDCLERVISFIRILTLDPQTEQYAFLLRFLKSGSISLGFVLYDKHLKDPEVFQNVVDTKENNISSKQLSTTSLTKSSSTLDKNTSMTVHTDIHDRIIFRQLRYPIFKPLDVTTQELGESKQDDQTTVEISDEIDLQLATGQIDSIHSLASSTASITASRGNATIDTKKLVFHSEPQTYQLTGYSDHVFVECTATYSDIYIYLNFSLTNQTTHVLQNVHLELTCSSDMEIIATPPKFSIPASYTTTTKSATDSKSSNSKDNKYNSPSNAIATANTSIDEDGVSSYNCKATIRLLSTESGVINGNLIYDHRSGTEKFLIALAPISTDLVDYFAPSTCPASYFRSLWTQLEWENKVIVNTRVSMSLSTYLLLITNATKLHSINNIIVASDAKFLSANLFSVNCFGEEALANLSIELTSEGKISGFIRVRSKTQGIALGLGDKITKAQNQAQNQAHLLLHNLDSQKLLEQTEIEK